MPLKLKYFVLKPAGTSVHAFASRAAMRVYASLIVDEDPELATQLREWVAAEDRNQFSNGLDKGIQQRQKK